MARLPRYRMCFLCGLDNPIGLKLTWEVLKDGSVQTVFIPRPEHQGYKGVVHGGILSALLDETMGLPMFVEGETVITAELTVRFMSPAPIGEELIVLGEKTDCRGRLIEGKGIIRSRSGQIVARGCAKYIRLPKEQSESVHSYLEYYEG